ncbi:MAG: response regulator transcription factor [Alphaproteobacteria bacterium]|nr:response regulator transcription factor [Alphaproteobacteria bacterium]MDP7221952.1 response regulator transcription factor [Alphaproteobacteria bacterium]
MRILIVEDDKDVSAYIAKGMKEAGHTSDIAGNGKDGLFLATTEAYDVLIIDRMLPELDGLRIIQTLRGAGDPTPAIILSALGEVDDRVKGLRSGGDDYLVKPFAFAELLARVEVAANRRSTSNENGAGQTNLQVGDLTLDLLSRAVKRGGQSIDLQATEFRLLEYLLKNKGTVVTRTMLLENVWDYHFDPQTNVIDVHISRLRSKIDKGREAPFIRTVRGAGYIIDV